MWRRPLQMIIMCHLDCISTSIFKPAANKQVGGPVSPLISYGPSDRRGCSRIDCWLPQRWFALRCSQQLLQRPVLHAVRPLHGKCHIVRLAVSAFRLHAPPRLKPISRGKENMTLPSLVATQFQLCPPHHKLTVLPFR